MSPKPPSRVRHALTRLDKPAAPGASPSGKSASGQATPAQTTQGQTTQGQSALRRTAEELKGDRAATIKQAMDKSMSWFEKLIPSRIRTDASTKRAVPEGVWAKCPGCQAILYRAELERNLEVCPKCSHHSRLSGRRRLETFLDPEGREEIGAELESLDPLKFKDLKKYKDRLVQAQKQSSEKEAMIVMRGRLKGQPIVASAFEFGFMGGSMGSVVGERFVRGVEAALEQNSPYVCFSASGGARMQESLFSLMQMAKTSAALGRMREHSLPFVSVMTDPTMGGVSASLAMLGDLNIAEPNALIGFAGPRVIEQTVHEKLPEGFQRSEFLIEKGALDMIMDRRDLRERIADLLAILTHRPRYVRTVVPV